MALSGLENQVTQSVEKLSDSIVSVSSMRLERRFFGIIPSEGQGSGIILDKKGLIITNNHVIDGANQVRVSLKDGRTFTGEVVGADEATDVAVIRWTRLTSPPPNWAIRRWLELANSYWP